MRTAAPSLAARGFGPVRGVTQRRRPPGHAHVRQWQAVHARDQGRLDCLDAATGEASGTTTSPPTAQAKVPDWGFSSSPLVARQGDRLRRREDKQMLLAYDLDTGSLAWACRRASGVTARRNWQRSTASNRCFTSATAASLPSTRRAAQCSGSTRCPTADLRATQPLAVGPNQVLANYGLEWATVMVEVPSTSADAGAQKPVGDRRSLRNLKPPFNDLVVHNGFIYGFDGSMFTCVDLKDGSRKWKKGRDGAGQVMLLPDQPLLLVISGAGRGGARRRHPGQARGAATSRPSPARRGIIRPSHTGGCMSACRRDGMLRASTGAMIGGTSVFTAVGINQRNSGFAPADSSRASNRTRIGHCTTMCLRRSLMTVDATSPNRRTILRGAFAFGAAAFFVRGAFRRGTRPDAAADRGAVLPGQAAARHRQRPDHRQRHASPRPSARSPT